MTILVDHTHLGRHVTGYERITLDLFSRDALQPLAIVPVTARGTHDMIAKQTIALPAALLRDRGALLLCPGFPPQPPLWALARRVIPYVHDVFLISRRQDLNLRSRLYMAGAFAGAVRRLPRFLVNSQDTARKLRAHCRPDAEIVLYRPRVANVFGVDPARRLPRRALALRLVALGTVEPRKNFLAAGRIAAALREQDFPGATLEIIGRRGWGADWETLRQMPGVDLRGYLSGAEVRQALETADLFLCTSYEEGLGLPLLEAQHAGLPVAAPDQPVFREVLGDSGIFIDPADPAGAARAIAAALAAKPAPAMAQESAANLARWNASAAADRERVIELLARLERELAQPGTMAA